MIYQYFTRVGVGGGGGEAQSSDIFFNRGDQRIQSLIVCGKKLLLYASLPAKRFPSFRKPKMPVMLPVSKSQFPVTNLAARFGPFPVLHGGHECEGPKLSFRADSKTGRTSPYDKLSTSFTSGRQEHNFLLKNP